ncbi:hypothetical protein HK405_013338 [Cladochytrium tenue]|nr:hypothetical protein HK405_013338 [Cladochytrium tenue]
MDAAIDEASSASARDVGQSPTPGMHDTNQNDNALPITLLKNVQAGNLELVKDHILDRDRIKADIETRVGPQNETILHFAILRNGEIAKMIAEAASDKLLAKSYENERYFGETALHLAVVQNRPEVIDILLGCGKLDLKALATGYEFVRGTEHKGTYYAGMTALQFAVYHSTSEVVEKLLIGADKRVFLKIGSISASAVDLIKQVDLYGNNVFHILAMRKSPVNADEIQEIKNINSAIRHRLIFKHPEPSQHAQTDLDTPLRERQPEQYTAKKNADEMKLSAQRFSKATNEGFAPAGELGAPHALMELLSEKNKEKLTPSQMAAFYDNSGFLEAIRLNQLKFGTSSSSVIKVELLSKPPDVVGRFEYDYPRSFFEVFLLLSTIVSLRASARTSLWKYFFCGLVIAIFAIRGVVFLSHQSMVSWTTKSDLSPPGNGTVDSLENGAGPALGSWLLLENFLFSAASICAWCNMLYFFKAFKSGGVLFCAFREILLDILTWSTMFAVFCLAFGGALFIQMEASDNDPWAPYWWTLVWVARFVSNHYIDNSLSNKAREYYDSHIGYRDFLGSDESRKPDDGSFITLIEINAKDGVPANVIKAVVGYWDEHYELDGLKEKPETTSGASSSFGTDTATGLPRGGNQTSSGAKELSTDTNLPSGTQKVMLELPQSEHTVVHITDVSSPKADVPPAAESSALKTQRTDNSAPTTNIREQEGGASNQGSTTNTPVGASSSSQKECIDPATSPAHSRELYTKYQQLLATHMPVELRIAEDYWAHWLAGLWHIFAVYWVWDVFRPLITLSMIYKKADLDHLQPDGSTSDRKRRFPQDRNLWFGHPLVIRQKRPSTDKKNTPEGREAKVKEHGKFALE